MVTRKVLAHTATAKKSPATAPKKVALKKVTPHKSTAPVTVQKSVAPKKVAPLKQAIKPVKPVKAVKPTKVKKPKMVRDSFTMPKDEYVVIDSLKLRGGQLGQGVKKSELLRAGIKALAAMSDIQFKAALSNVPTIKTGRPTSAK
jgi:hypothetical protein